jgi:intracellular sulfur oxidation DsrE/DsrF family protein
MRPRLFAYLAVLTASAVAALSALSTIATVSLALVPARAAAQPAGPTTGPVVIDFGPAYAVPNPGLPTPMLQELKVRFDVAETPSDVKTLSPQFETAARFLNMHVKAGVSRDRLKVAIVVHGSAAKDVLGNDAYRKRHGVDNPNASLLEALQKAGVRVYLCGQTAGSRGIVAADVAPVVKLALSAMTAHLVLNSEGYVLNPF